jgi:exopolysaccharide biosynthesis polyprenyl glycosylphosphotransferase
VSTVTAIYDRIDERTLAILEQRRGASRLQRRGWLVRRALLVADLVGLATAFVVAEQLSGGGSIAAPGGYVLLVFALPAWVVAAKLYGLYDKDEERTDLSTTDDFSGVFHLVTVITWLIFILSHFTPEDPGYRKLLVFWTCAVVSVPVARVAGRAYCRRRIEYLQNTAIVGAGDVGQALARKLLRHPEYGINLVGFVDREPRAHAEDLQHLALLGEPTDLPELVRLLDVERVIFAFSADSHEDTLSLIRTLSELNVQVDIVPRFFEVIGAGMDVHSVEGVPVISLPPLRLPRSSKMLKRALDIVGALLGITLLAPLFVVASVLIKLDSPGPVFFRQVRAGGRGGFFRIWKFRTMVVDAERLKDDVRHLSIHARAGGDPRMFKVADDPRVTRVGRRLRSLSIDELPQLLNVLRGEMSLVGPRPLILEEDRWVIEEWATRRLDLKPGMTGLWQVLGRSNIPFGEMVRLDYLYVTGWSLMGDIRLILRTIPILAGKTRAAT